MRMLIVEDDAPLAGVLRQGLEPIGLAIDIAGGVREAEDCLAAAEFDILILDVGLPDGDGLGLLRALRRRGATVPVLVLTARDAPAEKVTGLDTGADDYLVKPFHLPELASRVRALLRRPGLEVLLCLDKGNVRLDPASRQVMVGGQLAPLTHRETSLLELLMRGHDRVLTRDQIEAGLYDFGTTIGSNAVDVLVYRLRHKLQHLGATANVHTLRGIGYMLTLVP
jgi:DNA-binding response OmpR family regulator